MSAGFTRPPSRSSNLTGTGAPTGRVSTGGSAPPAHATNVPARASPARTATGSMSNRAITSASTPDTTSSPIPANRSRTPRISAAVTDASYARPSLLFISGPKYPRTCSPAAVPPLATATAKSPASSASTRARPSDTAAAGSINPDTTRPTPATPPRARFAPPSTPSNRRLPPAPGFSRACPAVLIPNVFAFWPEAIVFGSPSSTSETRCVTERTDVSSNSVCLPISAIVKNFPRFSSASRNSTTSLRTSPFLAFLAFSASGLSSSGTSQYWTVPSSTRLDATPVSTSFSSALRTESRR
ncbi:hypothetical protein GCM10009565_53020 [Amycolatopsis albidoflavus]